MKLETQFPLATLFFKHWSVDDTEDGIVVAKATFVRAGDRWVADPQPSLNFEDEFSGDASHSALVHEQDIAPGKVGTDLIVHAVARSPKAARLPEWSVSLTIPEKLHYGFHVFGPSNWTKEKTGGWIRTRPEPVSEIPMSYALAFGGTAESKDGVEAVHENNPSGLGLATESCLKEKREFAAPQIGLLAEFMSTDPLTEMSVHGFGPIAKSWLPRRGNAGTFYENWKETRHPRMPKDYSLQFWNAAPTQLQCNPPLIGNERLVVEGISHNGPVHLKLPSVGCVLRAGVEDEYVQSMVLDTVILDLRSQDTGDFKVDMIWRDRIASPERFEKAEVFGYALED